MPATSLEKLHQQIAQRERELEALRQELDSRRNQFTTLTRRKEELQSQLREVESEIAALTVVPSPASKPKQSPPPAPQPTTPAKARPPMSEMILAALRDAGKPMTARQLSDEISRRGFPLTGSNPAKSVESRLQEMKQKKLVRRAPGQPGYVLAPSMPSTPAVKTKTAPPAPKEERKATANPVPASKPAPAGQPKKQPSLREALSNVLKNSRKHLSGSELAERVLAAGYKTNSAKFTEAVWSMLAQMDNIEHIKGKGYRLKR